MSVIQPIHPEGQPNLKPGRYVTVLEMMPAVAIGPYGETTDVPQHHLSGIVLRVIAVQIPYVCTMVVAKHNDMPAGARITFDLRRHKLGFLTHHYARKVMKYDESVTKKSSHKTSHSAPEGIWAPFQQG